MARIGHGEAERFARATSFEGTRLGCAALATKARLSQLPRVTVGIHGPSVPRAGDRLSFSRRKAGNPEQRWRLEEKKKAFGNRRRINAAAKKVRRHLSLRAIPSVGQVSDRRAPFLSTLRAPLRATSLPTMGEVLSVATYNVHRWMGLTGRSKPDPSRACRVIAELDVDIVALQEVLLPVDAPNPLAALCDALDLHFVFAATRVHKKGQLGNAILSRFPIAAASVLDISHSRIERRGALGAQFDDGRGGSFGVVATHLSLVDRTRERQVKSLLAHAHFQSGPAVLLGDMNAWRRCKATRTLNDELEAHHNRDWPASYPSSRPVLALDRVYAHDAKLLEVHAHETEASRKASDHLPIIAYVECAVAAVSQRRPI